jgi:transposase
MWTDTTRALHARNGLALPSDMTDAEWAVLEPLLPPASHVGRPRKWPLRRIVEAILYLLRGGLPWRMLPPCFPPVSTVVHAADIQDRDGAPLVLAEIVRRFPWLRHVFADGGYAGDKLRDALRRIGKWTLEIIKRSDTAKGFKVLPRRWVVERTLAWLNRNRRLAKDFEQTIASATAWLFIASIQLSTRRIARS